MSTAATPRIDSMPKCTPQKLEQFFGRLEKSVPMKFHDSIRLESRLEAESQRWQHDARPYVNAGLANLGIELPTMFLSLVRSVMGPEVDADRKDCESFLLDAVVASLKKYDPYRGGSVVAFVRCGLIWKYLRYREQRQHRQVAQREFGRTQREAECAPCGKMPACLESDNRSALQSILIGEEKGDRVIISETHLTEMQRMTIYLRYFRGISSEKLAVIEGVSASGIENRIQRGRKSLAAYCKVHGTDLANIRWQASQREISKIDQRVGATFLRYCSEVLQA